MAGRISYYGGIVKDGLVLDLDAAKKDSYISGSTSWYDITPNYNTCALTNGPTYSSDNGGSIVFDGSDDFVKPPNNSLYQFTNFTLSVWSKVTLLNVNHGLVDTSSDASNGYGYSFRVKSDNKIRFWAYDANVALDTTDNVSLNTWVNILVNYNNTTKVQNIYINGVLVATNTHTNAFVLSTISYLRIGSSQILGYPTKGNIGQVLFYNRVLSAAEVLRNYNAVVSRYFPIVSDSDAQAFIVSANIQDTTQAGAINTFVIALKGYGLWTKFKAIYPMLGGTAASHSINLINPRNTDSAYRLSFNGAGWVHSSTGAKPNGTSDYANTFLNPSTAFADFKNNNHLSIYSRTQNPISDGWNIAVGNADVGDPLWGLAIKRPTWNVYTNPIIYDFGNYSGNGRIVTTYNDARGFWIGSTTASNSHKLYRNGTSLATSTNVASGTISNANFYIGRINNTGGGGINYGLDNELALVTVGDGLTDAESSNFYIAVQAYETTLGRQV
jgi:hypothetical protein